MKKVTILLLLTISFVLCGCAGMTESSSEKWARYKRDWALQSRMMVDDAEAVMLLDGPSSLTPYYIHHPSRR